ncbi:hypothetical protein NDU88_000210, partial [Pleurodeles waltl]
GYGAPSRVRFQVFPLDGSGKKKNTLRALKPHTSTLTVPALSLQCPWPICNLPGCYFTHY